MELAKYRLHFSQIGAMAALLAFVGTAAIAQEKSTLPPGVIATQGNVQVSLQDIDAFAAKMPESDRAGFFDSPKRVENVISSLLLRKQLAAKARAEKLDQDAIVQREIDLAAEDVLAGTELDHYRKSLKLPDFEGLAKEYYLGHKEEFVVPGIVDVKHVLIATKNPNDDEAKARIGEVEAAARAHPEQFDALIEKYSDDPTKKDNHGLIADAASARMAHSFADAAKALQKPGEISPIVRTNYGFHVLQLVSRKPDTQKTFAEVHADVVKKLRDNYLSKQMDQYTGEMRGKPVDANPDLVASLRTRYLREGEILPEDAAKGAAAEQHPGGTP